MGFMDKAKKLAEQAQQKLDEAQKNFNQGGSTPGQAGGNVRYDEHGRPIQDAPAPAQAPAEEAPPAGTAPPPPAEPAPAASEPPPPPAAPAPPAESGDSPNTSPDPFKPLQQ
jgi:hypothetical protein